MSLPARERGFHAQRLQNEKAQAPACCITIDKNLAEAIAIAVRLCQPPLGFT
jgi:hypothetical protein